MSHPLYNPYASGNQSSTQGQYGLSSIKAERDPRRATPRPVPDEPAASTESSQPKYTSESAANILLHFGLEEDDLEHLISYPEDQITPANLPFILRQIHIQKCKRTAVQSKPSKGLPTPTMMHDYAAASPRIFPHTCSLCNKECTHMKDWISHQNSSIHLENCKLLRQQYPDWDGEIELGPRFRPCRSPRCDRPNFPGYRSRSRSPERRLSPRSGERPSSTEGSSSQQKSSSHAERHAKKLQETSAVQLVSKQPSPAAVVRTRAPVRPAALDKMKSSSSSSSSLSYSKGGKPSSSPPSTGRKRMSPIASSSSSTAKKKELTAEPSKAKLSLQKSETSSSTKTGTVTDNLSTNGTLETHGIAGIDMANMAPKRQGASTPDVSTCVEGADGGGAGEGGISTGVSPSGSRRLGAEERKAVQSMSKRSDLEVMVETLAPALAGELYKMKSASSSSYSKGGKTSSSPPSTGGKRMSPTTYSSSTTAKKRESTAEPSKSKLSLQKSKASSSTKTGTGTDNLSTNGTLETHGITDIDMANMEPMELLSEIPAVPAHSNNPPPDPQPGPSGGQRIQLYGHMGNKLNSAQLGDPDAWAGIFYARPGWTPYYSPFLQPGYGYWQLKLHSSISYARKPPQTKHPKKVACGITCYDHPRGPWCEVQSLEGTVICFLAAPQHSSRRPPKPSQQEA